MGKAVESTDGVSSPGSMCCRVRQWMAEPGVGEPIDVEGTSSSRSQEDRSRRRCQKRGRNTGEVVSCRPREAGASEGRGDERPVTGEVKEVRIELPVESAKRKSLGSFVRRDSTPWRQTVTMSPGVNAEAAFELLRTPKG